MNSDNVTGFATGLTVGVVVTLVSGYFLSGRIVRKVLTEYDAPESIHHLRKAQEILDYDDNAVLVE